MSVEDVDTSRTAVKTYIPAYQKDEWQAHAEKLEMTQSEFVRSMVQAGRRGFLDKGETPTESEDEPSPESEGDSESDLAERVEAVLATSEHLAWDELVEALTDDIESRLEETLADLQDENRVRYSGRNGGYTLVER
jgi:hypothetical protein